MERRLAAILAADVVGYSRLIRADEEGTLDRLKALRSEIIDPKIAEHHGRIVKLMGDGMLAEFASVVDAVRAAIEAQRSITEHNAGLPEEKRIEFRVGINLGDVVIDGDDIQGDGVNVAARLEGLADPGGICVSGGVYDQVRDRVDAPFEDMGKQEVKNIDRPVQVWRWVADNPTAALGSEKELEPLPLPDKPSIAVLPFDNMSGDPEQEYFSDGIAEDIITGLSSFHSLFVIARNSTFTYKGRAIDVTQVARELGVRYVLEGSTRKAGNQVRITAQLIDAETGRHVWAERYDRELEDVFAVQDDIAQRVVTTVAPAVELAEQQRAARKPPDNMGVWDCYQRGMWHTNRLKGREFPEARRLFERAINLDPKSALGFTGLAWLAANQANITLLGPESDVLTSGLETAKMAVALDETHAWAHVALGRMQLLQRQTKAAILEFERAVELNPNFVHSRWLLGAALIYVGRTDEGSAEIEAAERLSPRDTTRPFWRMVTGAAMFLDARHEDALSNFEEVLHQHPRWIVAITMRAANLSRLGKTELARGLEASVHEIRPDFRPPHVLYSLPFTDPRFLQMLREALTGAGWTWE